MSNDIESREEKSITDQLANTHLSSASPSSSSSTTRPTPVPVFTKLVKQRSADGSKVINDYKIISHIGDGGYASVELVQHVQTLEFFAMKKMSKKLLSRQREYTAAAGPLGRPKVMTALDKVRKEIAISLTLWHPNIVTLCALIDDPDEDGLYLILEYMEKGQVMDWQGEQLLYQSKVFPIGQGGGIEESSLRSILHDVLNGLEYLHQHRIIHRDVKPDNLLVDRSLRVKIADFGVARQFTDQESGYISETHGTYHFFAPEMCTGEKYSGYIADIYALGLTLFIMATGVVPFMSTDNNSAQLFEMIATQAVTFPETVTLTPELKELILLIMEKDPNKRYTIAQIRAHPWMQKEQDKREKGEDVTHTTTTNPILDNERD